MHWPGIPVARQERKAGAVDKTKSLGIWSTIQGTSCPDLGRGVSYLYQSMPDHPRSTSAEHPLPCSKISLRILSELIAQCVLCVLAVEKNNLRK